MDGSGLFHIVYLVNGLRGPRVRIEGIFADLAGLHRPGKCVPAIAWLLLEALSLMVVQMVKLLLMLGLDEDRRLRLLN